MKFGRELTESTHPSFRNYYIAYKDLKQAIKIITGEALPSDDVIGLSSPIIELLQRQTAAGDHLGRVSRTAESQFQELLDYELNKINNFTNVQFAVLTEEIREVLYRLSHGESADSLSTIISDLSEEIVAFDEYIRLNLTGFRKALKKFDKWNKSDSSNWFLQRVVRSDFMTIQIDKLLLGLSLIASVRTNVFERDNACDPASLPIQADPSAFKRTKFFIPSEDLVRVEAAILKNALVVYPWSLTAEIPSTVDILVNSFGRGRGGPVSDIAFTESVVIFDDLDFNQMRTRRERNATKLVGGYSRPVFSLRWNQFLHKEGRCCIVRECHPKWVGSEPAQYLLEVRQRNLSQLLTGRMSIQAFVDTEGLGGNMRVAEFLGAFVGSALGDSAPSAMYSYRRTMFKKDSLFIAVDKDIKFVDLRSVPNAAASMFQIPPTMFQSILTQRTMTLWTHRGMTTVPEFITEITGSPSVTEVSGFSKAIHAEAVLHVVTELDRPVTVGLPHWFLHTISADDGKANMVSMIDDSANAMGSPVVASSQPSGGKFDVLPSTTAPDANSRLLLHDIVSAKEPKQQSAPPTPRPIGGPVPTSTPSVGSSLETPLLDRSSRQSPRTERRSQSIIDQLKFILFGSLSRESPVTSSHIEPKTFLANERTFLSWCYVAFIISAAAITLISVDPAARLEAAALSLVAVVTLTWSLNVYRLRVIALRDMKALDSLLVSSGGATTVCLSVVLALVFTWIGRWRQYMNSSDI